MISSRRSKAIGLFSGGLDSILATKLVTEQGIEVVALHFRVPFAPPGRPSAEERLRRLAEMTGASLLSVDVGADYLTIVSAPRYECARGRAPCVDCLVHMLTKAKELAREIRADFVFTGEVAGQRARSQNKRSLKLIEKASGLGGRLVRPLSAKLLEPTIPELTGLLRRERLLDIKGRGRRRQIRLAHEFGIIDYSPPTGGCLLTDKSFAVRVGDAVEHEEFVPEVIELLKVGRHFRLESGARVVVGRNERENARLEGLLREGDTVCRPLETVGPVVLLRSPARASADVELAARICARYSDRSGTGPVQVSCDDKEFRVEPIADTELGAWRIRTEPDQPEQNQGEES